MKLEYKDNIPLDARKALVKASKLANLTGVNHVVVKTGNYYNVYSEKEYPENYFELVKPEPKEEIEKVEEPKLIKKRANVVSKA